MVAFFFQCRQEALKDLATLHVQSIATDSVPSTFSTVSYPIKTILTNLKRSQPPPKSPKPSPRTAPNSPLHSSASIAAATGSASVSKSAVWMDHLWVGLIGKSYEDYRRDNPVPVNQNGQLDMGDGEGEPELRLSNAEIDEFILDAFRTKAEASERKQIKELILAYISRQHDMYVFGFCIG